MSQKPYARTIQVLALQQETNLVVYVKGFTSGFGGKIIVERSHTDEFPTAFYIRASPGNTGINPAASPDSVPTIDAYSFPDTQELNSIKIVDAEGKREIPVTKVEVATRLTANNSPNEVIEFNLTAVHDLMPIKKTLRVIGNCTMPTPEYKLHLKRHVPQGINPSILLLDLEIERPTGPVPEVITEIPVAYEEETGDRFTTVNILPNDHSIPVEEVH